jgi:hypothetical protein
MKNFRTAAINRFLIPKNTTRDLPGVHIEKKDIGGKKIHTGKNTIGLI